MLMFQCWNFTLGLLSLQNILFLVNFITPLTLKYLSLIPIFLLHSWPVQTTAYTDISNFRSDVHLKVDLSKTDTLPSSHCMIPLLCSLSQGLAPPFVHIGNLEAIWTLPAPLLCHSARPSGTPTPRINLRPVCLFTAPATHHTHSVLSSLSRT